MEKKYINPYALLFIQGIIALFLVGLSLFIQYLLYGFNNLGEYKLKGNDIYTLDNIISDIANIIRCNKNNDNKPFFTNS